MRRIFALCFAMLVAVPVAAANWTYRGNNEPDTEFDSTSWMFFDTDTSSDQGVRLVYFNGFGRIARETHFNPNVGVLGTRMQPAVTAMSAILGYWKDCNNDGYVGNAESLLLEYRAELLLSNSICGVQAPQRWENGANAAQPVYPHNDGTWIRELIWIGPKNVGAPSQNPTNFYSDGTGIWGDWGLPGREPTLVCPGAGRGVRSTGILIEDADCLTYFRGVKALNGLQGQTGLPVGGWQVHDVEKSDNTLNIDNPVYPFLYGNDPEGDYRGNNGGFLGRDSSESEQRTRLVTVVDCDSRSVDTSPEVATNFDINDPNTYPSAFESANDTYEVVVQGIVQGDTSDPCGKDSTSDTGIVTGHPNDQIEDYNEPVFAEEGRKNVDFPFEFSPGNRNQVPTATCRRGANYVRDPVLGFCPPADAGLVVERDDGPIGPAWRTNAQISTYTITTREGLKTDSPDIAGFYFTFYARLGPEALARGQTPGGGASSAYGSENCAGHVDGVWGGWDCDQQHWIDRCNEPVPPTLDEQCYRPNHPSGLANYHMRDIDCWDNTLVRGVGVQAGPSGLSQTGPCKGNAANEGIDVPNVG